jgi:hypothetical protein
LFLGRITPQFFQLHLNSKASSKEIKLYLLNYPALSKSQQFYQFTSPNLIDKAFNAPSQVKNHHLKQSLLHLISQVHLIVLQNFLVELMDQLAQNMLLGFRVHLQPFEIVLQFIFSHHFLLQEVALFLGNYRQMLVIRFSASLLFCINNQLKL